MNPPIIHFGIIHAVYRERHTLPACLDSLYRCGIEAASLFADDGKYGAFGNYDRSLRSLIELAGPNEYVCVVDDDLIVWRDTLQILRDGIIAQPSACFTLYTIEQNLPHDLRSLIGWIEAPVNWHTWGGMIVMPKEIAVEMIRQPFYRDYAQNNPRGRHCDATPFAALGEMGATVMHHIPSLTTDIGQCNSTIGTDHTSDMAGFRWEQW